MNARSYKALSTIGVINDLAQWRSKTALYNALGEHGRMDPRARTNPGMKVIFSHRSPPSMLTGLGPCRQIIWQGCIFALFQKKYFDIW